MRVQNPDQYASVLLNITEPNEHYTPEKIRSMYGSSEIDLKFPTPIPVNITYQTAFVDDAGKLQFRKDVYGRDATMMAMLKNAHEAGTWRPWSRIRSRAIRTRSATCRPASASPATIQLLFGPSFFERLFGAADAARAGPGRRRPPQRRDLRPADRSPGLSGRAEFFSKINDLAHQAGSFDVNHSPPRI